MANMSPIFRLETLVAEAFRVTSGALGGDAIGRFEDVVIGDLFRLRGFNKPDQMTISYDGAGHACIAVGSEVGLEGESLCLVAKHHLMDPTGATVEAYLVSRKTPEGEVLHLLPLGSIEPSVEYCLIRSRPATENDSFSDICSVRLYRGTRLTMSNGEQRPVEELRVGDAVLTRNHGPQRIRSIEPSTVRASGSNAMIRIEKGVLNTSDVLRLSAQHRIFVWQRTDLLKVGRSEVMVKAGALVDGINVLREEGGYVESYKVSFDNHEIIYAEGIAVESLFTVATSVPGEPQLHDLEPDHHATKLEHDDERAESLIGKIARASQGV